jgi:hypothetical protein
MVRGSPLTRSGSSPLPNEVVGDQAVMFPTKPNAATDQLTVDYGLCFFFVLYKKEKKKVFNSY